MGATKEVRRPSFHIKELDIEQSVNKSIYAISQEAPALDALITETGKLVQSTAPASLKVIRLYEIRDAMAKIVAPHSACKEGCGHCCKMAVAISSYDAKVIGKHIGVEPVAVKTSDLIGRQSLIDKYMGTACPFLKKNRCSIYEVRPSPCRTHFNLSAYPDICDIVENAGHDVPNLDWRPLWMAEAQMGYEAGFEFGDIRDFFPNGADVVETL